MQEVKEPFRVLLADGNKQRVLNFRLRGNPAQLHYITTLEELEAQLSSSTWDIIHTSLVLNGDPEADDKSLKVVELLIRYKASFRAVVLNTPISEWAKKALKRFNETGILVSWFPYNYDSPSNHVRKEI